MYRNQKYRYRFGTHAKILIEKKRKVGTNQNQLLANNLKNAICTLLDRFVQGWGGPLPLEFIFAQRDLQIKILARMRLLGITPVLSAFSGFIQSRA